jgi:TRAP-type C4-dicarboxylate transport system substrate-binding protein
MYSYVTSFGLGMNPDSYAALPADLQKLIDESLVGKEAEVGARWDGIDAPGKKIMVEAGMEPIKLDAAADAQFKEVGAQVAEARIKEMEEQGLPAREVYQLMQQLAAKYTPGSKNFWQE